MPVLILSNSAPNYHFFFNSLAKQLKKQGEKIVYAVDSEYSRLNNCVDQFSEDVHVFADFFSKHEINESLLAQYSEYNLNYALLSDFERAETYGIWSEKQFSNDYFQKLKSALLEFFEKMVVEHKIELILYENVSNTFAYFAYIVASKHGKNYRGFSPSRLPGRFEISEGPFDFTKIKETFKKIQENEIEVDEEIQKASKEYIKGIENIEPDYMRFNNSSSVNIGKRYLSKKKILKVLSLLKYTTESSYWNFQIGNPFKTHIKLFLRNFLRRVKCFLIPNYYEKYDSKCQFFLYPLHFHPESSTSVLSGNNLDEYEVIRSIAFNLPEGTTLFVKDHKSAWGLPTLKFYKKIKRLPNVKLLSPDEPTKQLIKKSEGIITLTSTVGYEALLLEKPVILLGRVFYEFHKNVIMLKSRDDMFSVLNGLLTREPEDIAVYNQQFIQAYWLSTHKGTLNLTNQEPLVGNNANRIVRLLNI